MMVKYSKKRIHRHSLAGLLLFGGVFSASAADEIVLVSVGNASDLGMKTIEVQSKVDSLKVFDVIANRGNCRVDSAQNALNRAIPGMGEYVGQLAQFGGATLKKKGDTLKFGEKILFMTDATCDIIELTVKTSEGDIKVESK